jgi:hypothetical protein
MSGVANPRFACVVKGLTSEAGQILNGLAGEMTQLLYYIHTNTHARTHAHTHTRTYANRGDHWHWRSPSYWRLRLPGDGEARWCAGW